MAKAEILPLDLKDGLQNLVVGMGTERDKGAHSGFTFEKVVSETELVSLYRTDWVSGKLTTIIPADMTREWRSFEGNGDLTPEMVEALEDEETRLMLRDAFKEAHQWARLFGGALLVMSIDGTGEPHEPLDISKIKKGALKHIKVVDKTRVFRNDIVTNNPLEANFGMPEFYRFSETSTRIHHTRVIRFSGNRLPFDEFRRNNYWDDSVLRRIYSSVINYNTVAQAASSMVWEANVDVIKIKGLMNYLSNPESEKALRKRFTLAKLLKSVNNMLLLDSEEAYEQHSQTFAGLPDLLDRYLDILSAASDIPATRLLGKSASGLNATGEGDLKNYYDMIRSLQVNEYGPKLDVFDKIMAMNLGLSEDIKLTYEWNSLFQMTDKEVAELEKTRAEKDQIYLDKGVVTEDIVAAELLQNGTYSNLTQEFVDELEEIIRGDETNTLEGEVEGNKSEEEERAENGESGSGGAGAGGEVSE